MPARQDPAGYASASFGRRQRRPLDSSVDGFHAAGGSLVMLAKGTVSKAVREACASTRAFYLGSIGRPGGPAGAYCIPQGRVLESPELGMERSGRSRSRTFPPSSSSTTRAMISQELTSVDTIASPRPPRRLDAASSRHSNQGSSARLRALAPLWNRRRVPAGDGVACRTLRDRTRAFTPCPDPFCERRAPGVCPAFADTPGFASMARRRRRHFLGPLGGEGKICAGAMARIDADLRACDCVTADSAAPLRLCSRARLARFAFETFEAHVSGTLIWRARHAGFSATIRSSCRNAPNAVFGEMASPGKARSQRSRHRAAAFLSAGPCLAR